MIYLEMADRDTGESKRMYILEPGNLAKLREGKPATTPDGDLICYTPDMDWLAEQLEKNKAHLNSEMVALLLEESMSRPEVLTREKTGTKQLIRDGKPL